MGKNIKNVADVEPKRAITRQDATAAFCRQQWYQAAINHMIIGVISDTHGVLSRKAVNALDGVDCIVHAGDIDGPEVLKVLARIAPVTAVRGNMDQGPWARKLPNAELVEFNGVNVYILHNLDLLDLDPISADIQVVISGHTHQPEIKNHRGILFFNPGSASYARHGRKMSIGRIELGMDGVQPKIVTLEDAY